jgi:hypothetical protein
MKSSKFKSLIIVAAVVFISGIATDTVFAQRSGRGGGNGGGGNGGGGARISQGGGSRSFQGGNQGNTQRSAGNDRIAQNRSSRSFQGAPGRSFQGASGRGLRGNQGRAFQGRNSRVYQRGSVYNGRPGRAYYGGLRGNRYGRSFYGRGFGGYNRPYYNYYRPFLGISIGVLPFGYYPFYYGANQFYYSGGLFYQQYENQYKVVVPPVGAEVPTLPSEAQEVVINGQTYFEYKGVYYTETANAEGKTVYVVAGKDGVLNTADGAINADNIPQIGDVVAALPDGSRQVMLKGQKYYVSEDGVYFEEIVDANNTTTYKVVAN